jgi:putative membrane protein
MSAYAPYVYAHDGRPLAPHHLWEAWSFEPLMLLGLGLTAALYARGVQAVWRSAGRGRGVRVWEVAAFMFGWAVLGLALVSPLHRLGSTLLSAHMVQHELLMALAAPLLVLGRPIVALLWALPLSWRRTAGDLAGAAPVRNSWQWLTTPLVAWTLHALAIWLWHMPSLYQVTLRSEVVHTAQHLSFLGTAVLFWWSLLQIREGRLGRPGAVIYLFTTALHTTLLGALLTFSDRPWYPLYGASTPAWGFTALEDQQLAGLIMWVPGGLAYLFGALAVAASWLSQHPQASVSGRRVTATHLIVLIGMFAAAACKRSSALRPDLSRQITGGDPERGALAIRHYGCAACHTVDGIPGANGTVGPVLNGIAGRPYIAGVLTNSPGNLTRWVQHPQQIDSLTAMPDVGLSDSTARDIVSYLYTLK